MFSKFRFDRYVVNSSPNGTEFGSGHGLWIRHHNGDINEITPTGDFQGFIAGEKMQIDHRAEAWLVSMSDVMPNWYVTSEGSEGVVIASTVGEGLDFVGPFLTERQWKRFSYDQFDPYTPEVRMQLSGASDVGEAPLKVLPQVVEEDLSDPTLTIGQGWQVVRDDSMASVQFEAQYLAGKIITNRKL